MDPRLRRVTRLPLEELWNADGTVEGDRGPYLNADGIRDLLRSGPVQFVEADYELRWIPKEERFDFWKAELRDRVVETPDRFSLDDYPDEYCYVVSLWDVPGHPYPVVVAEKWH